MFRYASYGSAVVSINNICASIQRSEKVLLRITKRLPSTSRARVSPLFPSTSSDLLCLAFMEDHHVLNTEMTVIRAAFESVSKDRTKDCSSSVQETKITRLVFGNAGNGQVRPLLLFHKLVPMDEKLSQPSM